QFVAEQIVYRPVLNPRSTQPETGVQTAQIHAVPDWTHVSASCAPDRIGGLVGLALRRGRPPTRRYRYCTSYYKERTLDHWLRRHRPTLGTPVAVVLGTRAAESPSRQKTPPCRERTNATARTRNAHVYDVHPVLAWSRRDVYRALDRWGVEPHPTYTLLGLDSHQMLDVDTEGGPRVSCVTCIFTTDEHLVAAAAEPRTGPLLAQVCGYETLTGLTWRQAKGIRPVMAQAGLHEVLRQGDTLASHWQSLGLPAIVPPSSSWVQPSFLAGEPTHASNV
ncbi:MAG: phosphoadenosine phosphosulfate reductase family protein, partial [Chloroflexi bacterium]|nr:phosphoadenosine phosphosulfate reductase family protein [Chloroflexota bacterium]